MDFALALTTGAGRATDGAQTAFVPSLLKMLSTTGQSVSGRRAAWSESESDTDREHRRRTDGAATPTEVIAQAESQRAIGTHAFRKDTLQSEFREHLTEQRQAQRDAAQTATTSTRATTAAVKSATTADTGTQATQDGHKTLTSAHTTSTSDQATKSTTASASQTTTAAETTQTPAATPRLAVRTADVLRAHNDLAASKVQSVTATQATGQTAGRALGGAFTAAKGASSASTTQSTTARTSPVGAASGTDRNSAAAAAKKPAATATPRETGEADANTERILRFIQTRIGKDQSTATMRLDPPELGSLRIRLDLQHDEVTVEMEAQTDAARRLLAEQLDTLRQGLESAGLHVARVELRVAENAQPNMTGDAAMQNAWTGAQDASPESRDQSAAGSDAGTDSPAYEAAAEAEPVELLRPATSTQVNVWA